MYATDTDHVGITFCGLVGAKRTSCSKHETPIYYANGCITAGQPHRVVVQTDGKHAADAPPPLLLPLILPASGAALRGRRLVSF